MVSMHLAKTDSEAPLWRRGVCAVVAAAATLFPNTNRTESADTGLTSSTTLSKSVDGSLNKPPKVSPKPSLDLSKFTLPGMNYVLREGQTAPPRLVQVGGGKIPAEAFNWFGEAAGGNSKSTLIVIIGGSSRDPRAYHRKVVEALNGKVPAAQIVLAPHPDLLETSIEEGKKTFKELCENATGIFLTGGDQRKGMDYLRRFPEGLSTLNAHYLRGTPFLGTSAGLAMMNAVMPIGRGKRVLSPDIKDYPLQKGLGIANPENFLEMHGNRNDFPVEMGELRSSGLTTRLMRTMAIVSGGYYSDGKESVPLAYKRGICIHEDTALITVGNVLRVEGPRALVYDPNSEIVVLGQGDYFDLSTGKKLNLSDDQESKAIREMYYSGTFLTSAP